MEISKQINSGRNVYEVEVPLKLFVIKPTHAKWILGLYDHLCSCKEMILKSFEMSGLTEAMLLTLPPENPFQDLM